MKKLVIKTITITCIIFVVSIILIGTLFVYAVPKFGARFYEKIGMHNLSLAAYNQQYKNSNDVYTISFMFDLSNKQKNYKLVKIYGIKLLEHDNYQTFIIETNDIYYGDAAELYNEENYIIKSLVKAQINTKQKAQAKTMAMDYMTNSSINEFFVFAVGACLDAGIEFSSEEIIIINERYNDLQVAFAAAEPFAQKVIKQRLLEMAVALFELTGSDDTERWML